MMNKNNSRCITGSLSWGSMTSFYDILIAWRLKRERFANDYAKTRIHARDTTADP